MRRFIVVSTGDDFAEGCFVMADSREDAAFRAAKSMRATDCCLVIEADDPSLTKFVTDRRCGGDAEGWNYVLKSTEGVVVGWSQYPFYTDDQPPHDILEICEVVNRLTNPKMASTSHIIIGTKLPKVTMCSSCYYCGDGTSDVYF